MFDVPCVLETIVSERRMRIFCLFWGDISGGQRASRSKPIGRQRRPGLFRRPRLGWRRTIIGFGLGAWRNAQFCKRLFGWLQCSINGRHADYGFGAGRADNSTLRLFARGTKDRTGKTNQQQNKRQAGHPNLNALHRLRGFSCSAHFQTYNIAPIAECVEPPRAIARLGLAHRQAFGLKPCPIV